MKVNTDGILIGAWSQLQGKKYALDIGTGSGLIALMLAQRRTKLEIVALEPDEESLKQATINFQASPFSERILPIQETVQAYAKNSESRYDLIVSNPPFFNSGLISPYNFRAKARHTSDTLAHHELLESVERLMTRDGHFDIILPYSESINFIQMSSNFGLYLQNLILVRGRCHKPIERLVMRFGRKEVHLMDFEQLTVYLDKNSKAYSESYVALTREFYLNM